jgi:hypothetical protein
MSSHSDGALSGHIVGREALRPDQHPLQALSAPPPGGALSEKFVPPSGGMAFWLELVIQRSDAPPTGIPNGFFYTGLGDQSLVPKPAESGWGG